MNNKCIFGELKEKYKQQYNGRHGCRGESVVLLFKRICRTV